jgi:hypothetical protein
MTMDSTKQNIVRAKQIVASWPEWKKNVQLTKYKPSNDEESKDTLQRQPELHCD